MPEDHTSHILHFILTTIDESFIHSLHSIPFHTDHVNNLNIQMACFHSYKNMGEMKINCLSFSRFYTCMLENHSSMLHTVHISHSIEKRFESNVTIDKCVICTNTSDGIVTSKKRKRKTAATTTMTKR